MIIIEYLIILILGLQLLTILIFILKIFRAKPEVYPLQRFPAVSVFVAARNEEQNIIRCLEALQNLDYPKEKIEILVGDDASSDRTVEIVNDFIKDKFNFKVITVTENLGKAKGKANVLAHLAHQAKGEFYFITDADISVSPKWVKTMLPFFEKGYEIVSGVTITEIKGLVGALQSLEWIYYMTLIKVFDDFNPITAIGNNMAISSKSYWATGGYENMEFSIVEDYKLFEEVLQWGGKHKHVFESGSLGITKAIFNFKTLMHQRKRWLEGGKALKTSIKLLLSIHGAYYPVLFILFFLNFKAAIGITLIKMVLQNIIFHISSKRLKVNYSALSLVLFEIFKFSISLLMVFYYILPFKWEWKGRRY